MATLAEIRAIFTGAGVPIATATETEQQRLNRILWEVNSGSRSLASVQTSVSRLATTATGPAAVTTAENRAWVIQQWRYLYGREPTEADVAAAVGYLNGGQSRSTWLANAERKDAEGSITRIYQEVLGRTPTAMELSQGITQMRAGSITRSTLTSILSGSTEGLARQRARTEEGDTAGQADAKARVSAILDEYGLGSLAEWAWEQVTSPYFSEAWFLQNLRQTEQYKQRFAGLQERQAKGLAPMSEADYIRYEQQARDVMRRNGMPPGFYDNPDDFVRLIGADVSPDELQSRIEDGYGRVMQAPVQVRQAFNELYGVNGPAALAALFIDPDKAEQVLLQQARSAEVRGWGSLYGMDFNLAQAERVGTVDLSTEQVRAGMGQLQEVAPLFGETVTETTDLSAEQQGAEAVFGLGGTGAIDLEQRRRTRTAALSGGGGANVDRTGVNLGAAD